MNEEFYENEIRKDFDKLDSLNSQADISPEGDLNSIVEKMGEAISKAEKTVKDYNIYNNLNNNTTQNKTKEIQKKLTDNKKRWKKLKEKIKLLKKNNKNDDNSLNDEGDDDTTNSIKYNTFNKLQLATRSTIEMENMSGNILGDLSNQSNQMKGVSSKIGLINDDIDVSNSVLGKMFSRQGRDKKIIIIFAIFLILVFLGTLAYKIVNKFK
jgi:predicted  nucleic acid-binding Zn-ribbon protein